VIDHEQQHLQPQRPDALPGQRARAVQHVRQTLGQAAAAVRVRVAARRARLLQKVIGKKKGECIFRFR
jgi:hypothetical protein